MVQRSGRFKTAHTGCYLSAKAYGAVRRFETALCEDLLRGQSKKRYLHALFSSEFVRSLMQKMGHIISVNEREQSEPSGKNVQDRCRARLARKTRFTSPDLPLHRNVVQLIEIKKHDCRYGTLLCISLRYLARYKYRIYLSRLAVSALIRPQMPAENTIYRLQESKYCARSITSSITLRGILFYR
jgi:hypothetical protein